MNLRVWNEAQRTCFIDELIETRRNQFILNPQVSFKPQVTNPSVDLLLYFSVSIESEINRDGIIFTHVVSKCLYCWEPSSHHAKFDGNETNKAKDGGENITSCVNCLCTARV